MSESFQSLIEQFLRGWAAFNPTSAFREGWREYAGQIPSSNIGRIKNNIYFLELMRKNLKQFPYESLSETDKLEYLLFENKIENDLFDLNILKSYQTNPLSYTGPAFIFDYLIKKYAPLNQRIRELAIHLEQLPEYYNQAKNNLVKEKIAPELIEMTTLMMDGMVSFLDGLNEELEVLENEQQDQILEETRNLVLENAANANKALKDFSQFLKESLSIAKASFRLGKEKYLGMLQASERVDNISIEKLLRVCQENLEHNLKEFEDAAKKIDSNKSSDELIKEIKNDYPKKETLIQDTQNMLETAKEYCRNIVTVPSEIMPKVIITPKPFRPFAFAAMDTPGALEKVATDSYYYITPPEDDWSEEQQKEWLQVFNYKGLMDITVHEAFPGHYLHFLHNQKSEFIMSKLFGAYHFWEGYALHVEEAMWEAGFNSGDYRYRMAQLLETLLRNVRMIVSIKLHTTEDYSVEEGTELFMKYAYLGRKPAETEAKRGTYDPGYLNYCLGKLMIEKLKRDYLEENNNEVTDKNFYNKLLSYGAPPIPIIRKFMLKNESKHGEIL
ncbi:MAG: hypothetical protein HeimC3_13450 [Candidatus Heimdallarchaeota archaeon LC_3]|nr:MAG: hypothetical protein HeimC3_13450 [Candidatus Heimdallarchaeota archaeon LC_3]